MKKFNDKEREDLEIAQKAVERAEAMKKEMLLRGGGIYRGRGDGTERNGCRGADGRGCAPGGTAGQGGSSG